jgi:hypothetical protein
MRHLDGRGDGKGTGKGTLFGYFGYFLDGCLADLVEFLACLVALDSMHLVLSTT